jgi:Cu(I)/Ag(I) efflux system membrane fusion protein
MDLIPLRAAVAIDPAADPGSLVLSKEAVALAHIRASRVERVRPRKEIRLYGTIQADERLVRSQVAHTGGRIEELYVRFTGETIQRGQKIATLYSPALLNAQQELIEAVRTGSPALVQAARQKLRGLKLTDAQAAAIEASGQPSPLVDIAADTDGIVTERRVAQGDYVNPGSILFELTDLSSVWALFDAYEADLPYLRVGDTLTYVVQALPGARYTGRIAFIDPALDKTTRTAKVRVETANPGGLLKPEMYAQAVAHVAIGGSEGSLVVPKTAVLWTGKRSVVYVGQPYAPTPVFTLRNVELGASLGDAYVILSGIDEGEEVVTSGAFALDASAQLEGKRSMMNDDPGEPSQETSALLDAGGRCEMCKERIEAVARGVRGVSSAFWDMETRQLRLAYDPRQTTPDAVSLALSLSGHDAGPYKADDALYDALPACCHYRDAL